MLRKVYCIDTGLQHVLSASTAPDDARSFENLVYLALRRICRDISYFDEGSGATAAVCDVFEGQPFHDPNKYTVDPGRDETQGGFRQDLQDLQDYGNVNGGNPVNSVNPVKEETLRVSAALRFN